MTKKEKEEFIDFLESKSGRQLMMEVLEALKRFSKSLEDLCDAVEDYKDSKKENDNE